MPTSNSVHTDCVLCEEKLDQDPGGAELLGVSADDEVFESDESLRASADVIVVDVEVEVSGLGAGTVAAT